MIKMKKYMRVFKAPSQSVSNVSAEIIVSHRLNLLFFLIPPSE